jgi:hypothetical protein
MNLIPATENQGSPGKRKNGPPRHDFARRSGTFEQYCFPECLLFRVQAENSIDSTAAEIEADTSLANSPR